MLYDYLVCPDKLNAKEQLQVLHYSIDNNLKIIQSEYVDKMYLMQDRPIGEIND